MLTAFDAKSERILNLVEFDQKSRDEMHGIRVARSNGYDIVCRQCEHGVHLRTNHRGRWYWQHNPGNGSRCILDSIKSGESEYHIAAKYAIAKTLSVLGGWKAIPEQRFERDGDVVVVDVYAVHAKPATHQAPTAWEVQLSKQTSGDTLHRTEERLRVAGCRTTWVTPHEDALGRALGVVSDPKGERVVGRLFTSPYDDAVPLPPMPLGRFVNKVAKRRGHFLWADVGDDRSWIAYPADSATTVIRRRDTVGPVTRDTPADDRLCARPAPAYPAVPEPHVEPERRPDLYEEPLSQPAFELVETKAQPATPRQQVQPARTTPGPDWLTFECPRCREETTSEFYGPCAGCVAQLRAGFS